MDIEIAGAVRLRNFVGPAGHAQLQPGQIIERLLDGRKES